MDLDAAVLAIAQISGATFVLASMLAMGLALTVPMILASISNVRLVVVALILLMLLPLAAGLFIR